MKSRSRTTPKTPSRTGTANSAIQKLTPQSVSSTYAPNAPSM